MPRETIDHNGHSGLISALPKWAQREIHRLDESLEAARKQVDQARAAANLIDNGQVHTLPTGERFVHRSAEVKAGERDWSRIEAYFHEDGSLDISAPGLGIVLFSGNRVIIRSEVFK